VGRELRRRLLAALTALALTAAGSMVATTRAAASPADEYTETHFGRGNLPPGCAADAFKRKDNACFHMRTGMNALDSPEVDVLLLVPASPTAARDMRIMRQAVEMWSGGIHYLAPQMGMPWLQNMRFHISTDIERATDGVVTYPIWDPEIVVIATNPVGAIGIGIDPWASTLAARWTHSRDFLCHGVKNPFDAAAWANMPGFDHHGDERGGTVTEDCGGAGGNICFAVNTAIDPTPPDPDVFNLFDLVAHEFGHCLTIGHVGDGSEGPWSSVPTNDIMSYDADPPGLNKCVSTLDVEGIAVTQSHYLDVNGDGRVSATDHLDANEAKWDDTDYRFQVQSPVDHYYASSTGSPLGCPQPDLGPVPRARTDWTPAPQRSSTNELTLRAPTDGARSGDGAFRIAGTVSHVHTGGWPPPEPAPPPEPPRAPWSVEFHHRGGNHFDPPDTSLGLLLGRADHFTLDMPQVSTVVFTLEFTSPTGASDLDLTVTGPHFDSGSEGATQANPEEVGARDVSGRLAIAVDPYLIADAPDGVDYTLRAAVTPRAARPAAASVKREHVRVFVDDAKVWAAHADVDTTRHADDFNFGLFVRRGTHTLRIEWERFGKVVATKTVRVVSD
jgi:hypothetical protein